MPKPNPDLTPWDVYVDERKLPGSYSLGFLVVPNTASFNHKLFRCRHVHDGNNQIFVSREIHWSELSRGSVRVAMSWIDCFTNHNGAKFYIRHWPRNDSKEMVILGFLARFTRIKQLTPPYNIAVLLDFDSAHAKAKIQNTIREIGRISRCYHFDSKLNDCLQCCDLLLGCLDSVSRDPSIASGYSAMKDAWLRGDRLSDSQIKRLVAGYALEKLELSKGKAYDLRGRHPKPAN